ncbi:MAG: 16S rRNA (guanine(527)-N(7))-methyltransferase RsmG [Chitinophagales bacterium]
MEKAEGKLELISKYFTDLSNTQLRQFSELDELYRGWNSKINVISRKDIESLYQNHILHSLSIAATFKFESGTEIIDIGTGGGFPGIPLAIYFPQVKFHLVDSTGKKLKVVEAIIDSIELKNCSLQQLRVEEIRNRKFDFAISRAVAPLKDLCKWSAPLLRERMNSATFHQKVGNQNLKIADQKLSGGLICLKGGNLSEEIKEAGCKAEIQEIFELFKEEYFRQKFIIYIDKTSMVASEKYE